MTTLCSPPWCPDSLAAAATCVDTEDITIVSGLIYNLETDWNRRTKVSYLFIYLSTIFIQEHPVQLKSGLNGGLFTYI